MTWATPVPILVFLGLPVLDLGPMYATERRQTDRGQTKASLNAPPVRGGSIITNAGTRNCSNLFAYLRPIVIMCYIYAVFFFLFFSPMAFVRWVIKRLTYLLT